jgi:hypothetical protein
MAVAMAAARRLVGLGDGEPLLSAAANGGGPAVAQPPSSSPAELDALKREVLELRASNRHLQEVLHASQAGSVAMRGFLSKHRAGVAADDSGGAGGSGGFVPWAGLFAHEWELRFFILSGTLLRWFKSDRDVALAPRGVLDVQGCVLEVENGGGGNGGGSGPFRFRIVEPPGAGASSSPGRAPKVLLRLSSDNRLAAEQWVTALEAAGLRVGGGGGAPGGSSRPASASGGRGVGAAAAATAGAPPAAVQDRWEQSSVDSELPESLPRRRGGPRPPTGGGGGGGAATGLRWGASGGGGVGVGVGVGSSSPPRPRAVSSSSLSPPRARAITPLPTVPSGVPVDHSGGGAPLGPSARLPAPPSAAPRPPSATTTTPPSPEEQDDAAAQRLVARLKRSPMGGSTPVYTCTRGSYLSSDGVWAAKHDGLLNLGLLLLVIGNLRLILENLIRYGIRVDPVRYVRGSLARRSGGEGNGGGGGSLPLLLCFPLLVLTALASVGVERLAARLARRDALKAAQIRKLAPMPASPARSLEEDGGGSSGSDGGGGGSSAAKRGGKKSRARAQSPSKSSSSSSSKPSKARRKPRRTPVDPHAAALALARDTAAGRRGTEALIFALQAVVTTVALAAPSAVVVLTRADIAPALLLTMCAIVTWAKLVSYHHCNADCRAGRRAGEPPRPGERGAPDVDELSWARLRYPENLSALNMLWFLATPTMTYQVNFPRSDRVRKRWLARRVAELLIGVGLALVIVDQYMAPACANSLKPIAELDALRMAERVLKLALPNLYVWLVIFYCLFHSWCNVLAELTRFGDREFYKDW